MHINQFKQGDIITRVEKSQTGDRSYIGDKLLFVEIVNGTIRYTYLEGPLQNNTYGVNLEDWSEGWEYYQEPIKVFCFFI